MGEITELLYAARGGNSKAIDAVFARVYPALRQIAGARLRNQFTDGTLGVTALVHETYLKLVGAEHIDLADQHHFFACAARAMRQILIDHARHHAAERHGGKASRADFDEAHFIAQVDGAELLDFDRALNQLDEVQPALRELVEMRVFAGLTLEELAAASQRSLRSVNRDWQRARALLIAQMD
ncbi:MAG TPA: ECF-type sigma factor [Rhodanobacteraceae bacterium]|nr:ECF-type sigma factor [Rhodanobacteraceae bacterium]